MNMMDLSAFRGTGALGRAYEFMMEHDAHAPASVDRELARAMVRLCPETVDELYGPFTPLEILYQRGSRPKLERILSHVVPQAGGPEEALSCVVEYTRSVGKDAQQDLRKMRVGGTEEQILERGSDMCTDVARVACVLCQIAGFPCRIVNLFNLDEAYSGHVIIEAYRAQTWGAADPITSVVYHKAGGEPATAWDLMSSPGLIEAHSGPSAFYTTVGQFRGAGIASYFCWESEGYDYTITGLNEYYVSILEMSNRGWPGGLRWLHGEDKGATEL